MFSISLYNYKRKLFFIVKKMVVEIGFKEVWVLKGYFNLFVFGFVFTNYKKNYDPLLWWRKYSLKLDYAIYWHLVLKGMSKSLIYMVKFDVSILNKRKIQSKYINIASFLIKLLPNLSLFWQNVFFPYPNTASYLKCFWLEVDWTFVLLNIKAGYF